MSDAKGAPTRREWLLLSLVAGVFATLVALLYPVARFLRPRRATQSDATETVAPFRTDQLHPDIEGKWPSPFNFRGKPCLIIRTDDGQIRAFNAVCTHTDCTVNFKPNEKVIFCACHNGVFDLEGNNISGPPPRPLEKYQVTLRGKQGQEEILVSRKS